MKPSYEAVALTENVYWVGALDWGVRNFHGYLTSRGTTYNAYLVIGAQPVLIDTVKSPFQDEMMARIASVVDPKQIHTIISNHSELDHSGALPEVARTVEADRILASKMGVKALNRHFHNELTLEEVTLGEPMVLGDRTFSFVETKMCHWPDSMVCYQHDDEVLFSQDAFGMHLCTSERFDDEVPDCILWQEAAKYYANILLPLSGFVGKALATLGELGLPIRMVAPDHGVIWRGDYQRIIDWYTAWAGQAPKNEAIVVYDTMWKSTDLMARAIGEGLAEGGTSVKLLPLQANHRSDVATHLLDAGALIVGSPTLNKNILPPMADCMTYLKGLNRRNLIGAAFGSYGWSGEGARDLHTMLEQMGVETVADPINVKYVPSADELAACHQLGLDLAGKLQERTG